MKSCTAHFNCKRSNDCDDGTLLKTVLIGGFSNDTIKTIDNFPSRFAAREVLELGKGKKKEEERRVKRNRTAREKTEGKEKKGGREGKKGKVEEWRITYPADALSMQTQSLDPPLHCMQFSVFS